MADSRFHSARKASPRDDSNAVVHSDNVRTHSDVAALCGIA